MTPGEAGAGSSRSRDAGGHLDDAGEDLARRARQAAYLLALQLLGNVDQARDVAQEAMLRFYRHRDRLDPARPVKPWLFQVVRNQVKDLWRRKRVRQAHAVNPGVGDLSGEIQDPAPGPEENALQYERRQRVWIALAALPAARREILVLRDFHDLTYEQLAVYFKIPVGTVMSRLHGARKSLRELLAGRSEPTPPKNQEGA